jgi:hypothetical protein
MAIVRAIALKDATATALTSCGVGTAFDLGAMYAGTTLYSGLHLLSSSTGDITFRVQGSSSSGFGVGKFTSHVSFSAQSSIGAQWATPLSTGTVTSTEQKFWRAEWTLTTSGDSYKALPWMSIE